MLSELAIAINMASSVHWKPKLEAFMLVILEFRLRPSSFHFVDGKVIVNLLLMHKL